MTDWLVVVPLIEEPEATAEAREKHDDPRVLYIDNTKDAAYGMLYAGRGGLVANATKENWGVSRSWNTGLRRGHDWTLILSSSVVLPEGLHHALAQFDEIIAAGESSVVFTDEGLHAFALSRKTVDAVGEFDEKFYPGYYEDNDWLWRLRCAGVKQPPWEPKIDLRANSYTDERIARALKRGIVKVDFGELKKYYVRKWGGPPGEERFTSPFGLVDARP